MKLILDLELKQIQKRVLDALHLVVLEVTDTAKAWLLAAGTSEMFGARELKRVLDRKIVSPLASILADSKTFAGDRIVIDVEPGAKDLTFYRKKGTLPKYPKPPALPPAPEPSPAPEPYCDLDFPFPDPPAAN